MTELLTLVGLGVLALALMLVGLFLMALWLEQ